MSIKHVGLVLENFKAKPSLKLVAVILADHADQDGLCWPSYRRIAEMTSQTERHVARHIKQLIELGVVTKIRTGTITVRDGKTIRLSNAYRVNAHRLEGKRRLKLSPDDLLKTSQNVHLEQDISTPSRWTPMSTKPSYNHKSNLKEDKSGDNSAQPKTLGEILERLLGEAE